MDIKLKLFINVAANFALFMIYAYLFGQQSIQKYFERGITIIKYTESPSVVIPPGRVLLVLRSGLGSDQ